MAPRRACQSEGGNAAKKARSKPAKALEALFSKEPEKDSDVPEGEEQNEAGSGTSQSSTTTTTLAKVKKEVREKPNTQEQKQMIAKLHYLKKTGKSEAYDAYHKLSTNDKRAWFHDVYQKDPALEKFHQVMQAKSIFKTEESVEAGEWLTAKQIMVANGYSDEADPVYEQMKTALLAGLEERPHAKPEMAALDIKQYNYLRNQTVRSQGSRKEDSVMESGSIDAKTHAGLANAHFELHSDGAVPQPAPVIQIEPWKKEALDFERKIAAATARASKVVQTAQSSNLKLVRIIGSREDGLAKANSENLMSRMEVMRKALEDFTVQNSNVNSKDADKAKHMKQVMEPALAALKEHTAHFEKVVNIVKGYLAVAE